MVDDTKEFLVDRTNNIKAAGSDPELVELGRNFVEKSGKKKYSYGFDWLGLPIIQYPQDVIALQEIIWRVKPDVIIETGVARGGSLVFYASLLEIIGSGQVIGVEIDLRAHNKEKILQHPLSKRISFVEGSSIAPSTFQKVIERVKSSDRVMVVLDSNHTHEHVREELKLYSGLVTKDSYLVVMDTSIDYMPDDYFPDRDWGKDNNPRTAVKEFLREDSSFAIDTEIQNKLLISVAYDGYLKKLK